VCGTAAAQALPSMLPAMQMEVAPPSTDVQSPRWSRVRRFAGYAGALAITPYVVIKVVWVVGALLGLLPKGKGFTLAGWITLNVVTIALGSAGIVLCLALARPWGRRIPAVVVLVPSWFGAGLLVPMIPFLAVSSALGAGSGGDAGDPAAPPTFEDVLIQVSFAGLALCLAVALPLYLRERWPVAFVGRLGSGGRTDVPVAAFAFAGALVVAAASGYWVAGGTVGLTHLEGRALMWRLLTGNTALWALLGAAAVGLLVARRPPLTPHWLPVAVAWAASGLLTAWSAWRLPFAAVLAFGSGSAAMWPENLAVIAAMEVVGLGTGLAILATLLSYLRSVPSAHDPLS
jgi:hypothetical protein